ncbi:hypothetical protein [Streptomyces exfoliatus]|uniref:hypothetical protein n=1 Tax=Streptomyces exfoliatus TaxID=1905 RepID=UPI0037910A5E
MHPRRTTLLILAALLTSGCVAVPHAPAPAAPPGPQDSRPPPTAPPAPLPTWPEPTQAAPREELTTTDPRPAPERARTAAPAAAVPAGRPRVRPDTAPSDRRTQPRERPAAAPEAKVKRKNPQPSKPTTRRVIPRVQAPKERQRPAARRQQPPAGQAPDTRSLCREAGRIGAPMGAADLCRSAYGR